MQQGPFWSAKCSGGHDHVPIPQNGWLSPVPWKGHNSLVAQQPNMPQQVTAAFLPGPGSLPLQAVLRYPPAAQLERCFLASALEKNSRWSLKPGVRPGETSSKLYSCGKHHHSLPSLGGKTSLILEWKPKQTPKPGSMIFMVFDDLRIQHPHCYNIKNNAVEECDNSRVSEWEKQVDTSHQEAAQPRHQLLLVRSNKNTL